MNKRQKEALERALEKQKGWGARRAASKIAREAKQSDFEEKLIKDIEAEKQAKPSQLAVNERHSPDAGDYERLLEEAGENKWAFRCALLGDDWLEWIDYVPKRYLGRIVVAAWMRGLPPDKLRGLVEACWGKGTPYVIEAAGNQLFNMLRACEWPLLAELPDEVEIWRGARGCTVEQAGHGLCWSLDRDVACAWLRILEVGWAVRGAPLVIRRVVPRSAIAMIHVPGNLVEVVIEAEPGGQLDGTPADWNRGRLRWVNSMVRAGKMNMEDMTEIEKIHQRAFPGLYGANPLYGGYMTD